MAGTSPAMTNVEVAKQSRSRPYAIALALAGRGEVAAPYFSPTLNGSSLPGGTVSSAIARIIATIT